MSDPGFPGAPRLSFSHAAGYGSQMLVHPQSPAEGGAAEDAVDDETMAEYEAKGGISHEAVRAWIRSWGTPHELPRPKIGD